MFTPLPNSKIVLSILYQDEDLLIVDKPAGLACHPLRAGETETLANALVAQFPELTQLEPPREAGLIHRLDNDTSGLVMVARHSQALKKFKSLSQAGKIRKDYIALVTGSPPAAEKIMLPIGHHPKNKKKMVVAKNAAEVQRAGARPAVTEYKLLSKQNGLSLLRVTIWQGARHQIRVHLAAAGYPILGDKLYAQAGPNFDLDRQLLHAEKLNFLHPFTKKKLQVEAPLPEIFRQVLRTKKFSHSPDAIFPSYPPSLEGRELEGG